MKHVLFASMVLVGMSGVAMGWAQPPAEKPAEAESEPKAAQASTFKVVIDPAASGEVYSGRIYVVISKGRREPRLVLGDWFGKTQLIAMDVKGVKPGEVIDLATATLGWPKGPLEIEPGEYTVQAIARVNPDSPNPGKGEGDLMSEPTRVQLERPVGTGGAGAIELKLTKAVKGREFKETDRIKLVEIPSKLLSEFSGRPRTIRAAVVLPKDAKDGKVEGPTPVLYWIGGFGGSHHTAPAVSRMLGEKGAGVMVVVPDPNCYRGHSVFADSANNGPWGRALIEELGPAVEAKFGGVRPTEKRHVSGGSSGGWSSLWLQVTYPEYFGGCWSHCPDPVDFRDFQRINLYRAGENMYKTPEGERRPIARDAGGPSLWVDDFVAQETAMGPGGQIHSFEAVFSPRGASGEPRPLFDRVTGAVDLETAKAWEPYDIRLVLERNWATLGPKLKGKVHVYAGSVDTFYLEGAAKLLKESLATLGSDATVEIVEGMAHNVHKPGIEAMLDAMTATQDKPAAK